MSFWKLSICFTAYHCRLMSSICSICFIVFALCNGWVRCAQWRDTSLQDSQMLSACAGDNVTFTWQYAMTSEEVPGDVQWLFHGQKRELVASSSRGDFLPSRSFSRRVSRVDNAGLSLSRVLVSDSGNYSVEVDVYLQDGSFVTTLRRTAVLYVSDRLMTTDGVLHVTHLRDPVYDSVSSQWVIQLQCGNFLFKGNPPYQVQWTTPSGAVYNSTSFSNGNFYLAIPTPIENGNYTCRIPAQLSARACLHGKNAIEGRASTRVESVEARLLLLEKENSDLKGTLAAAQAEVTRGKDELSTTRADVADLTAGLTALQTSHDQEIERLNSQVQQTHSQLSTTTADLQKRLGKLEDAEQNQVAFHATGLSASSIPIFDNTILAFPDVVYNQGNAYSPSTGVFTAPYSGLYFFIAKTSLAQSDSYEYHNLMVESSMIDNGQTSNSPHSTNASQSPIHGVVHLNKGQRVYVRIWSQLTNYKAESSAFTGFLLSRDPQ